MPPRRRPPQSSPASRISAVPLNKLASNVATGRNIAGVHWRSDGFNSLMLGEAIAIALLREHKPTFHEGGSFRFTSFKGVVIEI